MRVAAFEGATPSIAVDTLKTLRLCVDPITGKFEKTEYYILYI